MLFKKVALLSGFTLLAGSIVVPASSSVNRHDTTSARYNKRHDTGGDGGRNAVTTSAALGSGVIRTRLKKVFQLGNLDAI